MTTTNPTTTTEVPVTGEYAIDPAHSRIGFVARHAVITKVRGSFDDFAGSGRLDVEHPEQSSLNLVIQTASIDTRNTMRDDHLRSNDFLDVEQFGEITFTSTGVRDLTGDLAKGDLATFKLTGDLTIRGITKPVDIDLSYTGTVTDPYNNRRVGLEGTGSIKRSEWGVNWNGVLEAGGLLLSEEIGLEFEISAILAS